LRPTSGADLTGLPADSSSRRYGTGAEREPGAAGRASSKRGGEELYPFQEADEIRGWLAAIVAYSRDAIISKDLNGIITSWNAAAERLFGYPANEAIGRPVTMLIPPDRIDEEPEILGRIRSGENVDPYDTIRMRKDGTRVEISLSVSPVKDGEGRVVGASNISRDITERREHERQQSLLLSEMNHRIRNTPATVQAMATQTMRGAPADERSAFFARLQSLARAHDLLTLERWNRTPAREVVNRALDAFDEQQRQRFLIDGPGDIDLEASKAMLLAMVLHELATNAVKYGALSTPAGRIMITWDRPIDRRADRLRVHWREQGGPPVTRPERHGFGTRMIELSGGRLAYNPDGISCTFELSLDRVRR